MIDPIATHRRAVLAALALLLPLLLLNASSCQKGDETDKSPTSDVTNASASTTSDAKGSLPGAAAYSKKLTARLAKALAAKGKDYEPRTEHKNADGSPKYTNRLMLQSSPYLIQHAHNPVNWYPWGDEAFAEARRLGRPVLLSVGYSTCHWCHVMEKESFENEEIARYLNENYIAIKVDREERPDIDAVYMVAVRMIARTGGWPMTVWLTPDRKPFYGGTYFPPRSGVRGRRAGFLDILKELRKSWDEERDDIVKSSASLAKRLAGYLGSTGATGTVDTVIALKKTADLATARFDATNGGYKAGRRGNKFPSSFPSRVLLRYGRRTGRAQYANMVTKTLTRMAGGGMYDQVGGGFHRYSTDPRWLVPHFEKMLYDNAQLVVAYLEAYQATGRTEFADVARDILRYVRRDMTSPDGTFYSATDADSMTPAGEREEGAFFTWTPRELEAALDQMPGLGKHSITKVVSAYWAITPKGNFEHRNIPWRPRSDAEVAKELGVSVPDLLATVKRARETLYKIRATRTPPLRDEKVLAGWNGLMISAYARAAVVLGDNADGGPPYAAQAARAADFILRKMRTSGRLHRAYKDGRAYLAGYLDDYAFLIAGLLDLFEATGQPRWLSEAISLDHTLARHYEDKRGGFFRTARDGEKLLAREKPTDDGALPNGNSMMAMNLLRLAELTTKESYRKRADRLFSSFAATFERAPTSLATMALALDFAHDTAKQIVIVAPTSRAEAEPFVRALGRTFVPNHVLAVVVESEGFAAVGKLVPLVRGKKALRGKATAYVCERQRCELPTRDPAKFVKQIAKTVPLGGEAAE